MNQCQNCNITNNVNNFNFEWNDAGNKSNTFSMWLCVNCGINANITYDLYSVPTKSSVEEVINDFIVFDDDIENEWRRQHYLQWCENK